MSQLTSTSRTAGRCGRRRIEDRTGPIRPWKMASVLDIVTQGPGDVACCGSHKVRKHTALQEGRCRARLEGWRSAEGLRGDLDAPVGRSSNSPRPTSRWRSRVTLVSRMAISPASALQQLHRQLQPGRCQSVCDDHGRSAATRKSCPEPIAHRKAPTSRAESVSQWAYEYGRLSLYYKDDTGEPAGFCSRRLRRPAPPQL